MLDDIFKSNQQWAKRILQKDPDFFKKLQEQQHPEYFWVGCSDSRVPASEIMDLLPGEVFVHRNVANQVVHSDMNCLTALQYAVDVLKVRHIIVTGHYSCGGIKAAYGKERHGLVDNWLFHVRDTISKHSKALNMIADEKLKLDKICELNVIEQVVNLCHTTTMEDAWARRQDVTVNGLIYSLKDGHLKSLNISINSMDQVDEMYEHAKNAILA